MLGYKTNKNTMLIGKWGGKIRRNFGRRPPAYTESRSSMLNQFSRTQLLLGQDDMERLFRARVAVFGIGGVGGYTVEALARSGVGTLVLIDDDRVCLTNVNRQIFATRKTVGQYKVDVAEARIKEINPDAVVHTYKTFYAPQTADQFDFTQYDYVVDAIDTVILGAVLGIVLGEKASVLYPIGQIWLNLLFVLLVLLMMTQLFDAGCTLINSCGDTVASMLVTRVLYGKDWYKKGLNEREHAEI